MFNSIYKSKFISFSRLYVTHSWLSSFVRWMVVDVEVKTDSEKADLLRRS